MVSIWIWIGGLMIFSTCHLLVGNTLDNDALYIFLFCVWNIIAFSCILLEFCNYKRGKNVFEIVTYSLFVRIVLMFIDINVKALPMGLDKSNFKRIAYALIQNIRNFSFTGGYYASIMLFFGDNDYITQILHVVFSGLTMIIFYSILEKMNIDEMIRNKFLLLFAFAPYNLLQSVCYMRESVILLLITIAILLFVLWESRGDNLYFIGAIGVLVLASSMHGGCASIVISFLLVYILSREYSNLKKILIIVITVTFLIFIVRNYGDVVLGKVGRVSGVESLINQASVQERGESAYHINSYSNALVNIFFVGVLRMIAFLTVPIRFRTIFDIIAFVGSSILYLYALTCGIRMFLYREYTSKKDKIIMEVSLFSFLAMSYVFGWGTSNSGTALRHRDKMLSFAILLICIYKNFRNENLKDSLGDKDATGKVS